MMHSYTVQEWGKLALGEGDGQIPQNFADRLAALAQRSAFAGQNGSGVLERGRHHLRARGVVGTIAAQDCCLEILPKIDSARGEGTSTARKRLVHMLAVTRRLKIDLGSVTELSWQRETLLEILIRVFCEKLYGAIRKGIPRRYCQFDDDIRALRGKLNVVRQLTCRAANPSRLSCQFDELSRDIVLNQAMKAVVRQLFYISRSLSNQQRLRELAFVYTDVEFVPPSALRWNEIVVDRTNRQWQELIDMARLFLSNQYQETTRGRAQGIAVLFEMNSLFEEYIGRLVLRSVAGTDQTVSLQGGRKFCLAKQPEDERLFETRPDILIRRAGKVVHVIDTKWKKIASSASDPKQGLAQGDIYQMMAYAQLYLAPRLTLLYPHHSGLGCEESILARYRMTGSESILETASIDLADGKNMVDRIRHLLLGASTPTPLK